MAEKIGLISLGCSKNLVDSEQMLYLLDEAGYELTTDIDEADAVVVNTCGFIDEAKSEAIENILELCKLKSEKGSRLRAVIAAGCLTERHREEVMKELPELDAVVGCSAYTEIVDAVRSALAGEKKQIFGERDYALREIGRVPATPPYTAFVKICEGCDNLCSYCVIPSIRGRLRSRREEDILAECRALAEGGAVELIIIAQDITRYGTDIYGERRLAHLLSEICKIDGVQWVRLHYMNPDGFTDELIDTIAAEDKILNYLDIPIQHISDRILKAMNRHYSAADVRALFARLRGVLPKLVLRTSLIVGFPGETEEEFGELCAFLREAKIERAGVFKFSPQDGTPAAALPDQIDDETKDSRAKEIEELQSNIMYAYSEKLIGKRLTVLCEDYDRLAEVWYGRSYADSPDIDGKVFFTAEKGTVAPGQLVRVRLREMIDGDLCGEAVKS